MNCLVCRAVSLDGQRCTAAASKCIWQLRQIFYYVDCLVPYCATVGVLDMSSVIP